MIRKKYLSTIIVSITLLAIEGVSIFSAYAIDTLTSQTTDQTHISTEMTSFPEDEQQHTYDWSLVDWDEEVVLPQDNDDFMRAVNETSGRGNSEAVKKIKKKIETRGSDRAMDYYKVPFDVQNVVREYRREKQRIPEKELARFKELTANHIRRLLVESGRISQPKLAAAEKIYDEFRIPDVQSSDTIERHNITRTINGRLLIDGQPIVPFTDDADQRDPDANRAITVETVPSDEGKNQLLLQDIQKAASPAVRISQTAPLLIAPYDGIERNPFDFALNYLSHAQRSDGGFSDMNTYEISAEIAFLLVDTNKTDNDQYAALVAYLKNTRPTATGDKALKARFFFAQDSARAKQLLAEIVSEQNDDGGFGITKDHASDILTTAKVALALYASDHNQDALKKALYFMRKQVGADGSLRYTTKGKASYYLVNRTLEYLLLLKNLKLTGTDASGAPVSYAVRDTIDSLLGFLAASVENDTGTLKNSNDAIDVLMTYESFRLYDTKEDLQKLLKTNLRQHQMSDGSFGTSLFGTLAGLRAFAQSDFVITDIQSKTDKLESYKAADFVVTVKNQGNRSDVLKGSYVFIDGVQYPIDAADDATAVDMQQPIAIGETITLSIRMSEQTSKYIIGKTPFHFYLEGADESAYDNNWKQKEFTYASEPSGIPAYPRYYVAHKYQWTFEDWMFVNGKSDFYKFGIPYAALNIRWQTKDDTNRLGYAIFTRKQGTGENGWKFIMIGNDFNGMFLMGQTSVYDLFEEGQSYDVTAGVVFNNNGILTARRSDNYVTVTMTADKNLYNGSVSGSVTIDNRGIDGIDIIGYGPNGKTKDNGSFLFDTVENGTNAFWADMPYLERFITHVKVDSGKDTRNVRVLAHEKADTVPPILESAALETLGSDREIKNQRDVQLIARGFDDISLREALFYYWDPREQIWVFIGSQAAGTIYSSSSAFDTIYRWHIPQSVSGKEFKIKAVLIDYKGNRSQEKEYGPFEIIDTTPQPDLTRPNLEFSLLMLPVTVRDGRIRNRHEVQLVARGYDNVAVYNATFSYWDPATASWKKIITQLSPYNIPNSAIDTIYMWRIPDDLLGQGYKIKAMIADDAGNSSEEKEWGPFEIFDGAPPIDKESPKIDSMYVQYPIWNTMKIINQKEVMIIVSGSDNDEIVSATISLWDPKKEAWFLLSSGSTRWGQYSVGWIPPKNLLGHGFKIKATLTDKSGNISAEKEWGTFELVDGTLPTGSIQIEGLDNGKWTIGTKKKIQWNITSPNALKTIEQIVIYYQDGWYPEYVSSTNSDPTQTSIEYTMRPDAGYADEGATVNIRICDEYYTCATVASAPFTIFDPSPPPPAPWGKEKKFPLKILANQQSRYLKEMFKVSDGVFEFIYLEYDRRDPTGNEFRRIVYRVYDNGTWKEPVPLVEYRYKFRETDNIDLQDVKAVKDALGDIHLIFTRTQGNSLSDFDTYEIYYLRVSNGVKIAHEQISNDNTNSSWASIAADTSGNVYIAWLEGYRYTDGTGTRTLRYREQKSGMWSQMVQLTTVMTDRTAITLDQDEPVILASSLGQYLLVRRNAGTWNAPLYIVPRSIPKKDFAGVTDPQATLARIVEQDPSDAESYRWLDSIRSYTELEAVLNQNNVSSKGTILNAWLVRQYAYQIYDWKFFTNKTGEYDVFTVKGTPEASGWGIMDHFNITTDSALKNADVKARRLVSIGDKESVRSFAIVRAAGGIYHIVYLFYTAFPWGEGQHPLYFMYDGRELRFPALIASPLYSVGDDPIFLTEQNNVVTANFGWRRVTNTADFTKLLAYRTTLQSPKDGETVAGFPVSLVWEFTGGSVDSYSVFVGTSPYTLSETARGLETSRFVLGSLKGNTTYYWKIVGKKGDLSISSAIGTFTTPIAQPALTVKHHSVVLTHNETVTLDAISLGDTLNIPLTIENNSNAELVLTDNPAIRISGQHADEFRMAKDPDTRLDPGKSTKAVITFEPKTSGEKTSLITISSNDSNVKEFSVEIRTKASAPKMTMLFNAKPLANGSELSLGEFRLGSNGRAVFSLKNDGDGPLVLSKNESVGVLNAMKALLGFIEEPSYISLVGANNDDFVIKKQPSSPIAANEQTTFEVEFNAVRLGNASTKMILKSNDKQNSTYTVTVNASIREPEIDILHNDVSLGDAGKLSVRKPLEIGSVHVGESKAITLTIENTGDTGLVIGDGKIKAENNDDGESSFRIISKPEIPIPPGGKAPLVISFQPIKSGNASSTITIQNNDRDENPYTIAVSGIGIEPRIEGLVNSKSIETNSSISIDSIDRGETADIAITIKNSGTAPLKLSGKPVIVIGGTHAAEFSVINDLPAAPLQPSGSADGIILFSPKSKGKKTITVTIANSDRSNPQFTFTINTEATQAQLRLEFDKKNIISGQKIDIGAYDLGASAELSFSLTNAGNSALKLFGPPVVGISGEDAKDFSLKETPESPLAPAGITSFTIVFMPTSIGSKKVVISLLTNDGDNASFGFTIIAQATSPKIEVEHRDKTIADKGTLILGTYDIEENLEFSFTIRNSGTSDLILSGSPPVVLSGAQADEFSIVKEPETTVRKNRTTDFHIRLNPKSEGSKAVVVVLSTNDRDRKKYTMTLISTIQKAVLEVSRAGKSIQNDETVSLGDVMLNEQNDTEFILKNTGTSDLLFTGSPARVALSGTDAALFSIVTQPVSSLKPSVQAQFILRFKSSSRGEKSTTITIKNSDRDKKDYHFNVTATARAAKIMVTPPSDAPQKDGVVDFGNVAAGSSVEYSFTVKNIGNAPLIFDEKGMIKLSGASEDEFTITKQPESPLLPDKETTAKIAFRPSIKGEKNAVVSFVTNDPDAPAYALKLVARGLEGELDVFYDGSEVANAGTIAFGAIDFDKTRDEAIILKNSGDTLLSLRDEDGISISGKNADEFSIVKNPDASVAPNAQTDMVIRIQPKSAGQKIAHITIASTDLNESLYGIDITVTVKKPIIDVKFGGKPIGDGNVNIGNTVIGTPQTVVFAITNDGDADLTLSAISLSGNDASLFSLTSQSQNTVASKKSTTLAVQFAPGTGGEKRASISFNTNDPQTPRVAIKIIAQSVLPVGKGTGLTAEYYATKNLEGLVLRRTEKTISFDWAMKRPDPDVPNDEFSVRWKGFIEPQETGTYEFKTVADDGVRLTINSKVLIDDWIVHDAHAQSATIALEQGKKYPMTLEYFDDLFAASVSLSWKGPNGVDEIIPSSQLYPSGDADFAPEPAGNGSGLTGEYFGDERFSGLVMRRTDPRVNFFWKYGAPHQDMPADHFSVRWYGYVEPRYSGEYTFVTKTDDGVRLWINGKKMISDFTVHDSKLNTAAISLEKGKKYRITMEYFDDVWGAVAVLSWKTPHGITEVVPAAQLYPMNVPDINPLAPGNGDGLAAEYFKGKDFSQLQFRRIDPTINFKWMYDAPNAGMETDNFSIVWTGKLEPRYSGNYTLITKADDGIRMTVNGKRIIDDMNEHSPKENRAPFYFEHGKKYDIKIEYFEATGYATARLYWLTPAGSQEIIPQSQLYSK